MAVKELGFGNHNSVLILKPYYSLEISRKLSSDARCDSS